MNKLIYTLLFFLIITFTAFAGHNERSVLQIRLSDHSQLVVSIDGRYYDRPGRTITIGNLPNGWHDVRVYRLREYRDGGAHAKTIYTGRVRVTAGAITRCVVDVETRRIRIQTIDEDDVYLDYDEHGQDNYRRDNEPIRYNDNNANILTNRDLEDLKARVEDRISDTDRLKLMKSVLENRTCYSVQVRRMMEWLSFESSRLDFAKWAYSRVLDQQDYWKLEDVFTFSSSKDEFNEYISVPR